MRNIKKQLTVAGLALATLLPTACTDGYGDDLRRLGQRVEVLESKAELINGDIRDLYTIITAIEQNGYVTQLTENADGTYDVTFNDGNTVTLKNGRDGKDGVDGQDGKDSELQVSARKDQDGLWYWIVNGEWILDLDGNKMRAGAVDGKDGKDGTDGKDGKDGVDGKDGKDGVDGKDGLNGLDGKDGRDGKNGRDGIDGHNGRDGIDGRDGRDGIDGRDGKDGVDGKDGKDGTDGKNGRNGLDGKDTALYPIVRINERTGMWEISNDNGNLWINTGVAANGKDGKDGSPGADGKEDIFASVIPSTSGTSLIIVTKATETQPEQTFSLPILQQ